MIAGLKNLSLGLSRSRRKKSALAEKLPPALRILLFTALFVFSLAVRPLWLCGTALGVAVLYCIFCGFSLRKLFVASLKILPFLLLFSVFQMMFHPALPDEVRFTSWKWFMVTEKMAGVQVLGTAEYTARSSLTAKDIREKLRKAARREGANGIRIVYNCWHCILYG